MIMKILTLGLNLLMSRMQPPAEEPGFLSNLTARTIRKTLMVIAGLIGSAILFMGGFFTVLMDVVLASQRAQALEMSQASIVGFSMIVLSAVALALLFSRKTWELSAEHHQPSVKAPQANPIQDAVAELIRDFTEERKLARMMAFEQSGNANSTEADPTTVGSAVGVPVSSTVGPVDEKFPVADRSAYN